MNDVVKELNKISRDMMAAFGELTDSEKRILDEVYRLVTSSSWYSRDGYFRKFLLIKFPYKFSDQKVDRCVKNLRASLDLHRDDFHKYDLAYSNFVGFIRSYDKFFLALEAELNQRSVETTFTKTEMSAFHVLIHICNCIKSSRYDDMFETMNTSVVDWIHRDLKNVSVRSDRFSKIWLEGVGLAKKANRELKNSQSTAKLVEKYTKEFISCYKNIR